MSSSLNLLPPSTRGLLSSGQIVTSVNSVVKELIENSLDAGAKNVEVKLLDHGLSKISVRDNGGGVAECAVPSMVSAHTTSKISDFSDLNRLETYGFRGEALSAICSLANIEIETKR
jgi:DNA mismatch repair protein PMS1